MKSDREQLEQLVSNMKTLAAKTDITPAEKAELSRMAEQADALITTIKASKVVAQLREPEGTFSGVPIGNLYAASGSGGISMSGPTPRKSTGWGEAMVKAAAPDSSGFKALVPSGSVVVPSLTAGIVRTDDRPRSILQVVPFQRLEGTDQYSFLRETVRTHNAAPVATSALKPTSIYSVARVDETVSTIAHLSERIPRQTLADAALLRSYVEGSLREGVQLSLEDEIVNGDGTGEHLLGIDDTPNIQQQAFSSTILTSARKAVTKLETVNINSGTFVLAPADWEALELYADSTGHYILGEQMPVDRSQRRLWGLPVVTSTTLTAGKGFLVDFTGSTRLWERESVRVDWSENTYDPDFDSGAGATDFERNLIRFRAEGRWGFAVTRPAGVVEIDTAA